MTFVGVFLANNIYLFLMFSLWCLLIVLSGTICLIVLCVPLADTGKSRFQTFLGNLIAVNSNINLEKVKRKSRKGIIVFCFFFVSATVGVMMLNLQLGINFAAFEPWNQWFGFRILCYIFSVYGMGVWLLPILFFCITCLILEELFDDLRKKMSSLHSVSAVNIKTFMMEHRKLCEVVELADKVLSPLLLEMVSLYIPLLCFNFYEAVNLPKEDKYEFFGNNLFWLITAAGFLAIIMLLGSKVCEKVSGMEIYVLLLLPGLVGTTAVPAVNHSFSFARSILSLDILALLFAKLNENPRCCCWLVFSKLFLCCAVKLSHGFWPFLPQSGTRTCHKKETC